MTKRRISVELPGNLERIWDLGSQAVQSSNFALIASVDECFLIRGYFWGSVVEDLLSDISGASYKILASYEEYYEAIAPETRDLGFIKPHPGKPAHWRPTDPSMYKISGVGFEELKELILKNLGSSLTTFKVDVHGGVLDGPHAYEAWSCDSRKPFFEARGIQKGDFYWTNLNDQVIHVLCKTLEDRIDESAPIDSDPPAQSQDRWNTNELFYRVELDAFVFKIFLRARDAKNQDVFLAIRNMLDFFFGSVHQLDYAKHDSMEFFSQYLGIEPEVLAKWFEIGEGTELFLGDLDRNYSGRRVDWVRPDYVTIQIQESEFDPSFGTVVNGPAVTYMESFSNWEKTDFNRVASEPYLARLRGQANNPALKPKL
jgi:hypothetical protein